MRHFLCFLSIFLVSNSLFSQYSIQGKVVNAFTEKPVAAARVQLLDENEAVVSSFLSDETGHYVLSSSKAGRFQIRVTADTYSDYRLADVLIGSGPNTSIHLPIEPVSFYELAQVSVRARPLPVAALATEVSLEAVRRLPATFYDPARLIALSPAAIQTNDQANHLSVRGNSPNRNLWRLQGLAIVNPNHTANAGTIADAPTLSGGGVNAISAQLLDNSRFYAAALPVQYGQALGGTFDMQLRPGNAQKRQHQLQAGFIGFDLATEGPLSKGELAASYLLNARYSFTGLLGDFGVDFGGEAIRFQDVSIHLHQPLKNNGHLSFFALAGSSENIFSGVDSLTAVAEEKELFDIDFKGRLLIFGTTYRQVYERFSFSLGAAGSSSQAERRQRTSPLASSLPDLSVPFSSFSSSSNLTRWTARTDATYTLSSRSRLQTGLEWIFEYNDHTNLINTPFGNTPNTELQLTVPYLSLDHRSKNWQFTLAMRYVMPVSGSENKLQPIWEPSLVASYFSANSRFTFSAERLSQFLGLLEPSFVQLRTIPPPVSHRFNLAWSLYLPQAKSLTLGIYRQYTDNDYFIGGAFNRFLPANSSLELPVGATWLAAGQSQSYGLEVQLQKPIRQNEWYYQAAATVFSSRYRRDLSDRWQLGRYAQSAAMKIVAGKEWAAKDRKERTRNLGFNLALIAQGAERMAAIDLAASSSTGYYRDTYDYRSGFQFNGQHYFRPDIRLYKRKFHTKTTTTLALDIQNVLGRNNLAYEYYDNFLNQVVERRQLGFIPVLSYRVEWL